MYKIRIHEIIWFPYRPEWKLIGPLLVLLFLAVAATGLVNAIDLFGLFNSITAKNAGNLAPWMVIVLLVLCLVFCVYSARSDYISIHAALLPCFVTTVVIVSLSLYFTSKTIDMRSMFQAATGALGSLMFTGRIIQSGGVDLGALGAIRRRVEQKTQACLQTPVADSSFSSRRKDLTEDVKKLADELKKAAPETTDQTSVEKAIKSLQNFLARSELVDHYDFLQDLREGEDSLIRALKRIGGRRYDDP
ncbi:hypothetical protein JQ621_35255 [Bradyrhizobium manausense]|uniref:hypothetical protein n=1 Tax=Bradyrhizobium manausense TaxID=989370 RepID=UPI001BA6A262|nr:hypothetical protein [Bradyrhizobium manausense]MBR1092721.1 hypothetical protein [Bradyrhizobium manausense]